MRILLVAYFYEAPAGGGIIVARLLREQLQARGHTVDVLCLEGLPETQPGTVWRLRPPTWAVTNLNRFRQVLLFLNNGLLDGFFLRQAGNFHLENHKYEFVLGQDPLTLRLVQQLAEHLRIPCGATLHDTLPQQVHVGIPQWGVRCIVRFLMRWRDQSLRKNLARMDWLASISRHVGASAKRWMGPLCPPVPLVLNPAPADFADIPPKNVGGTFRFLFVGRLSPEKGVDLLLEAFQQLHGDYRLTIVGLVGSLSNRVRKLAQADPRVELRCAVPHSSMPEVYAAHHAVCCPVMWDEPFGLTVLEGRVAQCVVLGTNRGGLPEILEGYSRSILFGSTGASRDVIRKLLLRAMSEAPLKLELPINMAQENEFLSRFQVSNVVTHYEQLIRASVTGSLRKTAT